ncbi:MAG: hypothetical protein IPM06_17235 [Rhizobiales bacterium]|nr:hypothetical protein [Hyphomicrobiales bacterium]
MTDIKELALRVGKERAMWINDEWIIDFAQRFLAAYLAEQKPVAIKLETQQFQCFHVSAEDFKRLEALPTGTKLFTAPPTPARRPERLARRTVPQRTM